MVVILTPIVVMVVGIPGYRLVFKSDLWVLEQLTKTPAGRGIFLVTGHGSISSSNTCITPCTKIHGYIIYIYTYIIGYHRLSYQNNQVS